MKIKYYLPLIYILFLTFVCCSDGTKESSNVGIAQNKRRGLMASPRETNSIPSLLEKRLNNREAIIWYLSHSGWAVKTKNHFLIFDYCAKGQKPAMPSISNGYIKSSEIKDQQVFVFVSHRHGDHYDRKILKWEKEIKNITYVFGWDFKNGLNYMNMSPREKRKIKNIEILTIKSTDAGVGFLIKIDNLVIFHAGDHMAGPNPGTYQIEIDYLANRKIDIAFIPTVDGGCRLVEDVVNGALYAVEKLQPKVMFPMHGGGCEQYYKYFAREAEKKNYNKVYCAEKRGDVFFYQNGQLDNALKYKSSQTTNSAIDGDYFGQTIPGLEAKVFAPGIISTDKFEFNAAFSPDGKEFYYSVVEKGIENILFTKKENNHWTPSQPASFSSVEYKDADPIFSVDGRRLYFISTRPTSGNDKTEDYNIWYVSRVGRVWSEPKDVGSPVNSDNDEYYVSFSIDGTIYFASDRKGGYGSFDIYKAKFNDGYYEQPINLGAAINTEYLEHDPFITPDESFLLFTSVNRPDGYGSGDIYISFLNKDGLWEKAKNLGEKINTSSYDFCPIISLDGKFFFFTSKKDIYWINSKIISEYR